MKYSDPCFIQMAFSLTEFRFEKFQVKNPIKPFRRDPVFVATTKLITGGHIDFLGKVHPQ